MSIPKINYQGKLMCEVHDGQWAGKTFRER